MICPNKNSKLYKRLSKQLSEDNINAIWNRITSPEFDKWYGNRKRDSDGMPQVNKYLEIYGANMRPVSLFTDIIKLKTVKDIEKLFSANDTKGIGKYLGNYFITKNNREHGVRMVKQLNKIYPGLISLDTKWKRTSEIGVVDRSEPVIRLIIRDSVLQNKGRLLSAKRTQKKNSKSPSKKDYVINRLGEASSFLYDKIRDAKIEKNSNKVERLTLERDRIKDLIKSLQVEQNLFKVAETAQQNLDYVERLFSRTDVELNADELNEIGRILSLWENLDRTNHAMGILEKEDLEKRLVIVEDSEGNEVEKKDYLESTKAIKKAAARARDLVEEFDYKVQEMAAEVSSTVSGTDVSVEDLYEDVSDISTMSRKFRDAGSMANRLLQTLHKVVSFASRQAEQKNVKDIRTLEEKTEGLKKSSLFNRLGRQKFMELFRQPDGNLVNRYSSKYWKLRNDYNEAFKSKDPKKIKAAKIKHYVNHEYVNYFKTEEEKQAEIDRLTKQFGVERATELVLNMDETFRMYDENQIQAFYEIDLLENTTQEDKALLKEDWLNKNNPARVINSLKTGESVLDINRNFIKPSFDYVRSVPKKVNELGEDLGFYSEAYELISQDTIAFDYYNYVKSTIKTLTNYYPQSYLDNKGINEGFIPILAKQALKDHLNAGTLGSLKGLKGIVKGAIDNNLYGKTFTKSINQIKPDTGAEIYQLKIDMFSPKYKPDGSGELDTENIVTDLEEILKSFIPVSNMFNHKSAVESEFNLIVDSIHKLSGVKSDSTGAKKATMNNDEFADTLENLKAAAEFQREVFYGIHKQKREKYSATKKLNEEQKARAEEIVTRVKEIEEAVLNKNNKLSKEEVKSLQKELDKLLREKSDLGISFSYTKSLKRLLKYYQFVTLGWSVTSPLIELTYGAIANNIQAASGIDFDHRQMHAARKTATAAAAGINSAETRKFLALVEKFDVVGEVNHIESKSQNNSKRVKGFKKNLMPYELARKADLVSKGSTMAAVLKNTFIKDKNGEEVSLWEAYNEEGNIKEKYATEENIKNWNVNTEEINDQLRLADKISGLNIRAHGNYDKYSDIEGNSDAIGMAVLQHRRWMLEGFASRFEKESYNSRLGRVVKGRYITLKDFRNDLGNKATVGVLLKAASMKVLTFKNITKEDLDSYYEKYAKSENASFDDVDLENIRKNAQGLIWTIALTISMMILEASVDDDENKISALNFLINQGGRLQADLLFYSSPNTATDITGNIVPAFRLTDKISSWADAVGNTIFNYEPDKHTYQRGEFKGFNKLFIKTGELIPGVAQGIKYYRGSAKIYKNM